MLRRYDGTLSLQHLATSSPSFSAHLTGRQAHTAQWKDTGRTEKKTKTFLLSEKIFFVRIRVGLCKQKREIAAAVLLLPPFVENMLGHPSIVNCV